MIRYYLRTLALQARSGRSLLLLTLLGVALGVASVLSIHVIHHNALGAFEGSMRAVSGEADLTVVGRTPTVPEHLFPVVLAQPGVAAAWPLYRVDVAVTGLDEFYLEVLGLDLFAPVRVPWEGSPADPGRPLDTPGWVAVAPDLADELGLAVGDGLEVSSGSRRVRLEIGALVDFRKITPLASRRMVVMDIAQAQHAFGGRGRLHQIDVRLAPGTSVEEARERLGAALGPAVLLLTPEQRREEAAGLMGAFQLNLRALSLVSVFVGGFLVYASTQASLVRRRAEFGVLRTLGATRTQLAGLILGEVATVGLLGVAVGLPLGWAVALGNVERVSGTLSNLYLLEEIERLHVSQPMFLLAAAVGLAGALGGAAFPALEMSRRDARSLLSSFTLHERVGFAASRLLLAGCGLFGAAVALQSVGLRRWKAGGFFVGTVLLVALPLAAPWVIQKFTRRLHVRRFGLVYGLKALGLELHASAVAAAALAVAASMLFSITLMVGSFRRTVDIWLTASARADVYVTSASWRRARDEAVLDPSLAAAAARHPGVRRVDEFRQVFVRAGGRRVALGAIDFDIAGEEGRFQFYRGDRAEAFRRVHEEGAALISEPLARKVGLDIGDALRVAGPGGETELPVAGIYYDYSSEGGSAAIDTATIERLYGARPPSSLALHLDPGVDAETVVGELKARWSGWPLEIRSNRDLRREVFAVFDQTFAVTRLLQLMSLLIAVSGITLTLIVLARERSSELALYRALGASRPQIFRVFLGKGLGLAGFGLLLGAAGGVALAMILILLINRAYFGWTIAVFWPWAELARQAGTILAAAVLASLYPALGASAISAGDLSRET